MNRYLTEGLTPVFGLEDVGGYGRDLALYLIEQGYIVKFVNSSLSNSERNSYAMTQKNDSWDAQCVANVLIQQLPHLPDASPSDIHWVIGQLVGRRNALMKTKQGNRKLYDVFYNLAVQQVQVSKGNKIPRNPVFYAYYNQKQSEGKSKSQALLCIMRRLVRIVYGMMKNKTAYILPRMPETKAS